MSSELVTLRSGLTLPLPAVLFALDLERRGVHLHADDGDLLFAGPRERLTDEDRTSLRQWKPELLVLVRYVNQDDGWAQ
jgi:hypothetical protein